MARDHYEVLGVGRGASPEEINLQRVAVQAPIFRPHWAAPATKKAAS